MATAIPNYTLALIKPDAVKSGQADEIVSIIQEHGFTVLAKRKLQLTEDQAQQFYQEHQGKPFFTRLVEFMTSGPIWALALSKDNAVAEWRTLMGPTNASIAKAEAPASIRAMFGTDGTMNASHGSDSAESARREVQFFFPGVAEELVKEASISVPANLADVEKTLAMIKPDAVSAGYTEEILQLIRMAGFTIVARRKLQLTREQAEEFYCEHAGKEFYEPLVDFMTSGPIYALLLAKAGAIKAWRELMGPTNVFKARETAPKSLRALFGSDGTRNATHGSDSPASAARELKFFFSAFPEDVLQSRTAETGSSIVDAVTAEQTFAIIKPDALQAGHAQAILHLIERAGFTIIKKELVQLTQERAEEFYSEHRGKEFFPRLVDFMTSGPIYALVLAKQDAIKSWRAMMGPTNVFKAREEAPCSLRALFGSDGTQNATHGSDSPASALREIKFFFPSLIIDEQIEAVSAEGYILQNLQPTLLQGLTALAKEKPSSEKFEAITWLAQWILKNNPNKAKVFTPDQWAPPVDQEEDEIEAIEREQQAAARRQEEAAAVAAVAAAALADSSNMATSSRPASSAGSIAGVEVVTLPEETEDMEALNLAATKVQAGWRGHQARKDVEKLKVAAE